MIFTSPIDLPIGWPPVGFSSRYVPGCAFAFPEWHDGVFFHNSSIESLISEVAPSTYPIYFGLVIGSDPRILPFLYGHNTSIGPFHLRGITQVPIQALPIARLNRIDPNPGEAFHSLGLSDFQTQFPNSAANMFRGDPPLVVFCLFSPVNVENVCY